MLQSDGEWGYDQAMGQFGFVVEVVVAGLLASLACGLGVLPLLVRRFDAKREIGLGYAFAGGLMFSASFYNLLLPALALGSEGSTKLLPIAKVACGLVVGCAFLWGVERRLTPHRLQQGWLRVFGSRAEALVFIAMAFHSIPEGVAVGVGFASETLHESLRGFGLFIAVAIAIHNIPEGLAVALPMRAHGASLAKCFWFAVFSSLPQPIAAVPASLMVWFFQPMMLPLLGFAAGAMMYLVIAELIPDALQSLTRAQVSWSFMLGFAAMILVQVAI